ncbi:MAG: serine hydrolase domain-containing protein, partial [Thermoanaerobaculia bacterium]
MKRPVLVSLLLFSTLLPIGCAHTAAVNRAATGSNEARIARELDQYLTIRSEMGAFSGAVLVVRDGRTIFRKGYGYADVARRVPFTPETRHEVASVSKMFTAMAALKLRDAGRLTLQDSICLHLPDCPAQWKPITVDELIHHTSGIPDYEEKLGLGSEKYMRFMEAQDASKRIFEEAKSLPLGFEPGTKFEYSNTGYIVLSHVIENAAGEAFERFVRETLLVPAGMSRSGVLGAGPLPPDLAIGYTHDDLGWERTLGVCAVETVLLRKR